MLSLFYWHFFLIFVKKMLFRNVWFYDLSVYFSDGILLFCFIGIKPFQCDCCGKKFTRAYSLKMHRLKHEGKRCFRCQICSATFTSFGEYKHHMRVSRHIIRKPRIYECKTCGAMFTNSGNLIVHLRSLNHEASELANYFQSRWGAQRKPHQENLLSKLFLLLGQPACCVIRLPANHSHSL